MGYIIVSKAVESIKIGDVLENGDVVEDYTSNNQGVWLYFNNLTLSIFRCYGERLKVKMEVK